MKSLIWVDDTCCNIVETDGFFASRRYVQPSFLQFFGDNFVRTMQYQFLDYVIWNQQMLLLWDFNFISFQIGSYPLFLHFLWTFLLEFFFIAKIRPQIYYAANISCCIFTQNNMIMLSKLAHGENCCITMIVSELKHM